MAERDFRVENGMEIEYGMVIRYRGKEKYIVFPDDVAEIAGNAFKNQHKIEIVEIGKNIRKIYAYSFHNCYNLKSVTIPENVESVHLSAFIGCENLKELRFEGAFRKIDIGVEKYETYDFLKGLSEESLLQLIEYCPKVCFEIPSERCTDEFMSKAETAIINGMCKRAELDNRNVNEDVKLLSKLKEWKKEEYNKHLTPIGRLMTAIGEFKDNSK